MAIRARWIWVLAAALCAVVPAMGCKGGGGGGGNEPGPCPVDDGSDVQCIWEGPVSFTPEEVSQADGLVFVTGEMRWEPCSMIAGAQSRTYRVDPADGTTVQMDAPAGAEPVSMPADGPIEVVPTGASRRVRLLRDASDSVTVEMLVIGELVDDATGEVVSEISVNSVCAQ